MKRYILFVMIVFLSIRCHGQKNKTEKSEPKETWKVEKEFDENGNLTRFDSIYSWSSNSELKNLSAIDRDSLMQTFKSHFFTDLSVFKEQGFETFFSLDSLFSKHFFNDAFFDSDFMNIDKLRKQMLQKQQRFIEKHPSELNKPKDEN